MDRQHANPTTLWTFYFLLRDDSASDIFHASTHELSPVQQLVHSPAAKNSDFIHHRNAMISHPLLHLQLFSCSYGQLFPCVCSGSILMQLQFVQMLNCCCLCCLLTAHCSHFFPHWKDIPKTFHENLVH